MISKFIILKWVERTFFFKELGSSRWVVGEMVFMRVGIIRCFCVICKFFSGEFNF